MRIHGVHLQGIRNPPGEHRIAFDPGYCFVQARNADEARALLRLMTALLYPSGGPRTLGREFPSAGGQSARAGLSFSLAGQAYRVILDLSRERVLLGRYHPDRSSYQRVATEPERIAACLSELGLPSREGFAALHVLDPMSAAEDLSTGEIPTPELLTPRTSPATAPSRAPRLSAEAVDPDPEKTLRLRSRVEALRSARERRERLENELMLVRVELEKRRGLLGGVDDLEGKVDRFRELSAHRGQERAGVDAARRTLLDERGRLRTVPAAQVSGMWLGIGLAAAGALAGVMVQPLFYAVSLLGLGVSGFGLAISSSARRRLGRVEARLAALRVREAALERRFESETAPVRSLLQALELGSVDEIEREAAELRTLLKRVEAAERELDEARDAFPNRAASELVPLERALAEAELAPRNHPGEDEPPTPVALPEPSPTATRPARTDRGASDLEGKLQSFESFLSAAKGESGLRESELRDRLGPVLPIYLRALTGGMVTRAWYQAGEGWSFRHRGRNDRIPLGSASAAERDRLLLAFQLALLEVLAPTARFPLLIGPDLRRATAGPHPALARALQRLGRALQVIQISAEGEPWSASANSLYRLSG